MSVVGNVVSDILKVIYAPHKAFKNILQNPRYIGAIILLVIFAVMQVSSSYVIASKSYIEQTMPSGSEGDLWTENAVLWHTNPGVTARNNTVDFINSTTLYFGGPTYFGSSSVEFIASNISIVRMELTSISTDEQVNFVTEGFKNISFRLKILSPEANPDNVSLYLTSLGASSFYYDLTAELSNAVNFWNNITIPVGSNAWSMLGNQASWENITGFKMEFIWENTANVDLLLDGLFFRGKYMTPLELYGDVAYLAQAALNSIAPFIFEWIILTAMLYLVVKGLKGYATWKLLMVAVGFALVVLVVQAILLLVVYSALPSLFYPLEILAGVPGEQALAPAATLEAIASANLAGSIIQVGVWLWLGGICTFITREVTGMDAAVPPFGWLKCIAVSGTSVLLTLIIVGFLLGA